MIGRRSESDPEWWGALKDPPEKKNPTWTSSSPFSAACQAGSSIISCWMQSLRIFAVQYEIKGSLCDWMTLVPLALRGSFPTWSTWCFRVVNVKWFQYIYIKENPNQGDLFFLFSPTSSADIFKSLRSCHRAFVGRKVGAFWACLGMYGRRTCCQQAGVVRRLRGGEMGLYGAQDSLELIAFSSSSAVMLLSLLRSEDASSLSLSLSIPSSSSSVPPFSASSAVSVYSPQIISQEDAMVGSLHFLRPCHPSVFTPPVPVRQNWACCNFWQLG